MTLSRKDQTRMRHQRIRKKLSGTSERPRLTVHFSGKHIYAQLIDDSQGRTLASVNTTEEEFRRRTPGRMLRRPSRSERHSRSVARRRTSQAVVFDRGGFIYHGKVKALADAAREGGLLF